MPRKSSPTQPASPYVDERVAAIPVAEIHTDLSYQRAINQTFVDRASANLDMRAFGVLLVALRPDGLMYVCDGQHRLQVAKRLLWATVPCVLVLCESPEDEARLFLNANYRSAMNAMQRHTAAVRALDPVALALEAAVHAADLEIGVRKNGDPDSIHRVSAIATLNRVMVCYGADTLTRSLRVLRDAWHGENYSGGWLQAAARVLAALNADGFDDHEIIRRSSTKSVVEVEDRALRTAHRAPGPDDVAHAMVWAFNEARGRKYNVLSLGVTRTDDE